MKDINLMKQIPEEKGIEELTVAYSTDENYFPLAFVSMISCIENNPKASFIILHTELSERSLASIDWFREKYGCSVVLGYVDEKEFKDYYTYTQLTAPTWFRIKLGDYSKNLSRILYLDCDTLVLKNLNELWNTDLSKAYIAGVVDIWTAKLSNKFEDTANYFNAGVLLFNCDRWRKDSLYDKCRVYPLSKTEFTDQDTLNEVVGKEKILLHPKYNFMDTWWRRHFYDYSGELEQKYLEARTEAHIVHFTGCKPWQRGCKNIYFNKWWYYAKNSPIFPFLKERFRTLPIFYKRRPFFRWLFNFHYFLWKNSKIPVLTILGKEFFLCSAKCRKELRMYRQY